MVALAAQMDTILQPVVSVLLLHLDVLDITEKNAWLVFLLLISKLENA